VSSFQRVSHRIYIRDFAAHIFQAIPLGTGNPSGFEKSNRNGRTVKSHYNKMAEKKQRKNADKF
jgi:hypothetical protein